MARTILITGCSSGIGLDSARTLAGRGWRVFATCRAAEDCDRLRAEGLESFPLDLADEASVAEAAAEALARSGGRIDAVFNNGAFAIPGAVEDLPRLAFRAIFETNLFGQIDLTNRLLPAMRAAGRRADRLHLVGARPCRRPLARRLRRDEVRARGPRRHPPPRARRLRHRRRPDEEPARSPRRSAGSRSPTSNGTSTGRPRPPGRLRGDPAAPALRRGRRTPRASSASAVLAASSPRSTARGRRCDLRRRPTRTAGTFAAAADRGPDRILRGR